MIDPDTELEIRAKREMTAIRESLKQTAEAKTADTQAKLKAEAEKAKAQKLMQVINEICEHFDEYGAWQDDVFLERKLKEHGLSYPVSPYDLWPEVDEPTEPTERDT